MSVGPGPAGDQAAVREVVARLDGTLAASSVRVELRFAGDDLGPGLQEPPPARADHAPGLVERLVVRAAKFGWERTAAEKRRGDAARDAVPHGHPQQGRTRAAPREVPGPQRGRG